MRVSSALLVLWLTTLAGPAAAQPAPPAATPDGDVVAGPALPAWLTAPTPLPGEWRVQTATADAVTFAGGDAELVLERGEGAPAELLAALAARVAGEVGGSPAPYHVSVAGPWVEGRLVEGPRGGPRLRAVAAVRRPAVARAEDDGPPLTAVARGPQAGRGLGEALDLLARVRLTGEDVPPPHPALVLDGRPEARINPVGIFVTLPNEWKPELVKGQPVFWLRAPSVRIRFAKAEAADIRTLSSAEKVAAAFSDRVVEPLFWRPPGSHAAWQVLEAKDGAVASVRHLHLVRYKKLDDWTWHVVEVEGVDPLRGMAEPQSVLARLKKIP
jgi:hypothetical protein